MFEQLKKQFKSFEKSLDKPKVKKPAIIVEMETPVDYFPNEDDNDNSSERSPSDRAN